MYPRPPVPEGLDQGYLAFQAMHLPPREKGVRDTWSKINVNLSTIKSLFKRTFRSTHPTWTCHPHPLGHTPRSEPDGIDFASESGSSYSCPSLFATMDGGMVAVLGHYTLPEYERWKSALQDHGELCWSSWKNKKVFAKLLKSRCHLKVVFG